VQQKKMSNYFSNPAVTINIPTAELVDGTTFYSIHVTCLHNTEWTVLRRYRDFAELHEKLISFSISRDLLPKKRILGNMSREFVEQRREDLQKYLNTVFFMMQRHTPVFEFLDFHKFDVIFLLQHLALNIFKNGERYLTESGRKWTFTILEVNFLAELN
jgi:nischarin